MTREINTDAIEKGTDKPWHEWRDFLDSIDAHNLPHAEIAARLRDEGVDGWWAQSITVAYEQHIGRRAPGQDNDGEFSVSVNKTYDGDMDAAMTAWIHLAGDNQEFNSVKITGENRTSATDKWRHWRISLADGTRLIVSTTDKAPGKSNLTVTHEKLTSAEEVEAWRAYWKEFLTSL